MLFSFLSIFDSKTRLGDINGVKDKDGYVFLFNDLLVLARLKKDQALKYKEHASLQGLTVEDLKDEQGICERRGREQGAWKD